MPADRQIMKMSTGEKESRKPNGSYMWIEPKAQAPKAQPKVDAPSPQNQYQKQKYQKWLNSLQRA